VYETQILVRALRRTCCNVTRLIAAAQHAEELVLMVQQMSADHVQKFELLAQHVRYLGLQMTTMVNTTVVEALLMLGATSARCR
jgi:hypothetical protein